MNCDDERFRLESGDEFCENSPHPAIRPGGILNSKLAATYSTAMIVASIALGGCVAVQDFLAPLGEERQQAAPESVTETVLLEPLNRHFFTLESPHQSVVGELQIVHTTEENTLSDLAREYGLGYDEIVAANPGLIYKPIIM